ncbi:MAG: S41 family peptidase [Alphaproteobacteria bacterium]|nr:S41 family peptidase [Alphaproteobacteria bacterium]
MRFLATLGFASLLAVSANANNEALYEKLDIMTHVIDRIKTSYVDEISDTSLVEDAIEGMLTALDPHSSYLPEDAMKSMTEQTKGEFGGLGIEVTMDRGVVKVVSPIEGTPAYDAGVETGDLIIKIDDKDVQGLTLSEAVDMMRGKVGSDIKVKVFRESERKALDIVITRDIIKIIPVKSRLERGGVGYLRITTFNEHVGREIKKHLKDLIKENEGEALSGLVLDLRNNPGGLLSQAVAASDAFLEQGEIVSTRGRIENQNQRYNARSGDHMNGSPIVVLINGGSASASEIVAGALQDHKRALVIGTKSFGKGSVQTIMQLPGNAGMRLTTALYYTPSGRSIQAKGIEPDIEVKPLKVEDVDVSDRPSEASLKGHIELEKMLEDAGETLSSKDDDKEDKRPYDYQLERAIDTVKALGLWSKKA